MTELQSRTYRNGEKEITVYFQEQPDKDDGFAGYVSGSGLPYEAILCVDPRPEEERSFYEFAAIVKNDKLGKSLVLLDEERFRGVQDNNPVAMFMLFHELGHYIYNPIQRDPAVAKKYHSEREEVVATGKVIKEERIADEIAADYLGYDVVIEGLEWLLKLDEERVATGLYDLETAEISMKEIRLRIQSLHDKAGLPALEE